MSQLWYLSFRLQLNSLHAENETPILAVLVSSDLRDEGLQFLTFLPVSAADEVVKSLLSLN